MNVACLRPSRGSPREPKSVKQFMHFASKMIPAEFFAHPLSAALAHCGEILVPHRLDGAGEGLWRIADPAATPMRFQSRPRRPAADDGRYAMRQRFRNHYPVVLGIARQHEEICVGESRKFCCAFNVPVKACPVADIEFGGEALEISQVLRLTCAKDIERRCTLDV